MQIYDYTIANECFIVRPLNGDFSLLEKSVISKLDKKEHYVPSKHPKEIEREKKLKERQSAYTLSMEALERATEITHPQRDRFSFGLDSAEKTLEKPIRRSHSEKSNKLFIVNGCNLFDNKDCGFYKEKLSMLNDVLKENDAHLLFIRGYDNPSFFNDSIIELSNLRTIRDGSLVRLKNYNCLCIGGGISIDRLWKIEQQARFGKTTYFENEKVQYDQDTISKIISKYNIGCVITTSCPSFVSTSLNGMCKNTWCENDKDLAHDLTEERMLMDKLYGTLMEKGKKPYIWIHSKYPSYGGNRINDILFKSSYDERCFSVNRSIESEFDISLSHPLKNNVGNDMSSFLKVKSSPMAAYFHDGDLVINDTVEEEADAPIAINHGAAMNANREILV